MFKSLPDISNKEYLDFVNRLAYISEIKEWDNRPHLDRIRRYCYILTSRLGLTQSEIDTIVPASILHDIGKILLPEHLLTNSVHFEKSDWEIVESHTIHGANILSGSQSPILQAAETIAYTHHERWDGSGYPRGLRGEEIPATGRIVALADVYDALTSPRPYKDAIEKTAGLRIVQEQSGKLFDPELVNIFTNNFADIQSIV